MNNYSHDKIIFFDGVCGLCNGFIDFVIKHDQEKKFKFSPLQSDFAKTTLGSEFTQDLKTVIVLINKKKFSKSSAVFEVLRELGNLWSVFLIFKFLPTKLNNFFYDLIASNRYSLFGKKETCRIPTPEERSRFIL